MLVCCTIYIILAMKLGKKYPENIILLRYEDLCLDPYGTVDNLLKFLNYEAFPDLVNQYIQGHMGRTIDGKIIEVSQKSHEDPLSSVKNSKQKAFDWKSKMDISLLQKVEENCEKPMKELGYAKWNGPHNDQVLIKSALDVWPFG